MSIVNLSSRKLKDIYVALNNRRATIFFPSLLDGTFSEILFLSCYDYKYNKKKTSKSTSKLIHELFDYIQRTIQEDKYFQSFHTGISGAIWLLKYIELTYEYIELDRDSNFIFRDYTFKKAIRDFKAGHYDLFIGGIGNSMFLFENLETELIKNPSFVLTLASTRNSDGKGLYWKSKLLDGSGHIGEYLGLAHGSASVLVFYSKMAILNIEPDENKEICSKIIHNILSHKRNYELAIFPSEVFENNLHQNTRLAWCQGDLGIAAAIFNAGVTFNNKEWLDEAYDILHHIYTKRTDLEQNGIYDANICHGAAGVAHIFNKVYQYSKIPEFKKATDLWVEHTLYFAKYEDGVAGFKTMDNERGLINSTGLLTGISGIGLVLLSYLYPETVNTWDRCLLLS
jgi:lantibiotic modifying enzyme